jgi:hypothetical protein
MLHSASQSACHTWQHSRNSQQQNTLWSNQYKNQRCNNSMLAYDQGWQQIGWALLCGQIFTAAIIIIIMLPIKP